METFDEILKRANAETKIASGNKTSFDTILKRASAKRQVTQKDIDLVNTFYTSAKSYSKEYETDIKTLGWGNATTISDKYSKKYDQITAQGEAVKHMLKLVDIEESDKNAILKDINSFTETSEPSISKLKEIAENYAQFGSEEEYKQAQEFAYLTSDEKKAEMEKKGEDIKAVEKLLDRYERSKWDNSIGGTRLYPYEEPVAGPQGLVKGLHNIGFDVGDLMIENGDVQGFEEKVYAKIENEKKEISEYEGLMRAIRFEGTVQDYKKQFLEDGTLEAWEKSGKPNFAQNVPYFGEMSEDEKTVYNVLAFREGQKIQYHQNSGAMAFIDGEYMKHYKKQQKYGFSDKEMAEKLGISIEEYCENIQNAKDFIAYSEYLSDAVAQRKGAKIGEALKDKWLLQELFGIWQGFENWGSGIEAFFTGDSSTSATDYASQVIREDLKNDYGVWGSAWGGLYDVNTSIGQMLPSIALAYATGGASKYLGAGAKVAEKVSNITFKSTFGAAAYGNAYSEMINAGYTKSQAMAYATLTASSEVLLQDLLGGIGKFSGKITNSMVSKAIQNIDNAFLRIATSGFIDGLGEFTEEALQEVISPIFKTLVTGEINPINWGEIFYSGVLGFFTSTVMNGVPASAKLTKAGINWAINNYHIKNSTIKNLAVSNELYSFANTMPEYTNSYKLAQVVGKKGNAYNMLSELAHINKPITEETSKYLYERLIEDGYASDIANKIVDASVKVSNGISIPQSQMQAISINTALAPAILDSVVQSEAKMLGIENEYKSLGEKSAPISARATVSKKITEKAKASGIDIEKAQRAKATTPKTDAIGNKPISDVVLKSTKKNPLTPEQISRNEQVIKGIGKHIGYEVIFTDENYTDKNGISAPGMINKTDKKIYISRNASNTVSWLAKHEITHSTEFKKHYDKFVEKIQKTDVYKDWLKNKTGINSTRQNMEAAANIHKMLQYEEKGADLSVTGAQQENIADFVADMLFNDESGMDRLLSELDKPTRNKFIQWILDIINELKALFPGNSKQLREIKALEGKFRNLLTETKTVETKDAGTSKDSNYSLSPTKVKRLEQIIDELGKKGIVLFNGAKRIKINTDYYTIQKNIHSKKGRTDAEVNARIKAIPYFEDILKDAKFREKDTQIRDLDKDAKKGVTAIYHFDSKYDKYDIDIVVREKTSKYYLYEIKFIDPKNKKSSKQSSKEYSEPSALNNRDVSSNYTLPQNKPSVKQFSLEEETQNSPESNIKYSYAGEKAQTANIINLQKAIEMEESGDFTREEIRKATEWFRSYDGKWRFEIDDSKMHFKDVVFKDRGMTLGDILEHKGLFEAYPQLKDIRIEISHDDVFNKIKGGEYQPKNKKIKLNGLFFNKQGQLNKINEDILKQSLIHEIQHAIQYIEGFATGASRGYWEFYITEMLPSEEVEWNELAEDYVRLLDEVVEYNKLGREKLLEYYHLNMDIALNEVSEEKIAQTIKDISRCKEEIKGLGLSKEYEQASLLLDKMQDVIEKVGERQARSSEDMYFHTAGEIEAYDVADRLNYSEKDRQDIPPNIDKKNVVFAEKEAFISVDMDENQRYEILKDKKIQLQEIEVDKNFDIEVDFLENNIKSIVEKPLISKLQKLGYLKKYTSNAIDVEFEFTGKGLKKSIHSQTSDYGGNFGDFAKVVLNMQKLLDNSVLLEIHPDKGKGTPRENHQLVQTYVLLSAFKEGNAITPVQFEVKQYVDNNNRLYLAVALTKIEIGVMGNTVPQKEAPTDLLPISDISIADLFKNVNVKDAKFLKYAPNQFLNEEQIKAKEKELEKDREKYSKNSDNATQIFNPEDISFSLEESEIVSDYADRVDELSRQLRNQEITPEEYKKAIDELFAEAGKKHGTIKQGESVTGEEDFSNPVPKSVGKGTEIRQYIRTVMEAKKDTDFNEILTSKQKEEVLKGKNSYVKTSNEANIENAIKRIADGADYGTWYDAINSPDGTLPSAKDIALGELLLEGAFEKGDAGMALRLTAELSEVGTRLGQAVQSFSLLKRMGGLGKLLYVQQAVKTINKDLEKKSFVPKNAPEVKIKEELALQLTKAKTESDFDIAYTAILQDIGSQIPSTWVDKWNAWRYIAMLANPVTMLRNLFGNAIFVPVVKMKDLIATVGETIIGKKLNTRTKTFAVDKEYKNFAKQDWAEVEKAMMSGGKYNISSEIDDYRTIFKFKPLETVRKGYSTILEGTDRFFMRGYYESALSGYLAANKLDLKNLSKEDLKKARDYAAQEALKGTYRDASAVAQWLTQASKNTGVFGLMIEGVIPFKKTPINILKRGVEYSPAGVLTTVGKGLNKLVKGEWNGTEFIDGLASTMSGSALFVLGMWLASAGIALGGFDDEDEMWRKLNGEQEYSLRIGNMTFTVDWMAPACMPFFMGAEVYKSFNANDNVKVDFDTIIEAGGSAFDVIVEMSMLQGVQRLFESIKFTDMKGTLLNLMAEAGTSFITQHIPTIGGKIANTIDDTRRRNYIDKTDGFTILQDLWNQVVAKIPFASQTRSPYVNAWGEEEKTGPVWQRALQNFVLPGYLSTDKTNELTKEISRLYESTGNKKVLPENPLKRVSFKGKTKYLTEDEYYKYSTIRGQKNADYLAEFVSHKDYIQLSDEQKAEIIEKLYKFSDAYAKSFLDYTYTDIVLMDIVDIDEATYNGYSEQTKNALAKAYFLKSYTDEIKLERNGDSLVEYYVEESIKKAGKPKKEKKKDSVDTVIKDFS